MLYLNALGAEQKLLGVGNAEEWGLSTNARCATLKGHNDKA